MKTNYLFAPYFKNIGWCMFLPFMAGCIYSLFQGIYPNDIPSKMFAILSQDGWFSFSETGLIDEISIIGFVVSLVFVSFSREKDEDEYIEKCRLQSLVQSLMISCGALIFGTLFIYDGYFLAFTLVNMFILLLSFVIIFNVRLYKFRSSCNE